MENGCGTIKEEVLDLRMKKVGTKREKSILQKLIKGDKKDEVILGIRNCTE